LNAVKYAVIGALEERLPASPVWGAEWSFLSQGRGFSKYWPLTQVEQSIPVLFAAGYTLGFLLLVFG
jgi:hypothetical protein